MTIDDGEDLEELFAAEAVEEAEELVDEVQEEIEAEELPAAEETVEDIEELPAAEEAFEEIEELPGAEEEEAEEEAEELIEIEEDSEEPPEPYVEKTSKPRFSKLLIDLLRWRLDRKAQSKLLLGVKTRQNRKFNLTTLATKVKIKPQMQKIMKFGSEILLNAKLVQERKFAPGYNFLDILENF